MSFDDGYRRWRVSTPHASLMGEDYPESIEPFSFVPFGALSELAAALELGPGQTLVDLGCGRGGIGLWVATRTGSDLIGVDSSRVAIADARRRAHQRRLPQHRSTEFVVADAARTGLGDSCADGLICVDVLQLVTDPELLVQEIARLLRPGGALVLTTWEGSGAAPDRFPRRIASLLTRVGLVDIKVREHPDWLQRQLSIYSHAIERVAAGEADDAIVDLADEGRTWQSICHHVRRVSATARSG